MTGDRVILILLGVLLGVAIIASVLVHQLMAIS